MHKDFEGRNREKQRLDASHRVVYPKPREIWYIKMGINIGREMHGKESFFRPVLVISKMGSLYFCLAMSTKSGNLKYVTPIVYPNSPVNSYIVINQGRVYDMRRFTIKISIISKKYFNDIKNLLRNRYFPKDF